MLNTGGLIEFRLALTSEKAHQDC